MAGEPVGAAVAVRAVITLVTLLPKLKLTGVPVDPVTVAFRSRVSVTAAAAELAVTLETYAVRPLPAGLNSWITSGADVVTVEANGMANSRPDMAASASGKESIAGAR
ncbi:hypothetical protein D3C80_1790890 [compost metagenome]